MRISDWSSDVCSSDLDDGRFQFAAAHHFVEREAELVALAEADPADARGQALELDAFAGHVEPVVQVLVVGDQFLDLGVGLVDVLGVAAERDPAERADAAAEQRAHVGRDEAGKVEGVLAAFVECHLADVVAVVEGGDALLLEREHCLDVHAHGLLGGVADFFGVLLLFGAPLLDGPADRQVAVPGVVGAGLVGDGVGAHAALDPSGGGVSVLGWACAGGCGGVGSVTAPGRTPRSTSRGRISTALPRISMDLAWPALGYLSVWASASSRAVACSST